MAGYDKTIRGALAREIEKLIARHNAKLALAAANRKRYQKRSGSQAAASANQVPRHWAADPQFNPYHVRTRLASIIHSITPKVRSGTYEFKPSLGVTIPKEDGGTRELSLSTVVDSAIAYWLGMRLISRNAFKFSSYSYAYRSDRNAHHAIAQLSAEISRSRRLFSVEFDFANYFGSIDHPYLLRVLEREFQVSNQELALVKSLLSRPKASSIADYQSGTFVDTKVGIPQGSTLSLFLANVACYELDRDVERTGVTFARYADDTAILADSYEKAHRCATLFMQFGEKSGTSVNMAKSPGISLLTPARNGEMVAKSELTFLGHVLSEKGIRIAEKSVKRIKRNLTRIVYDNLLLQPNRGSFDTSRIGPGYFDWDLATLMNELRSYIYGRLTEDDVQSVVANFGKPNLSRNAMSFYPLVDLDQASELDGWLTDMIMRAYRHRRSIMQQSFGVPFATVSKSDLISGAWYGFPKIEVDSRLPSFSRSLKYTKRVAKIYGLKRLPSPRYGYLS